MEAAAKCAHHGSLWVVRSEIHTLDWMYLTSFNRRWNGPDACVIRDETSGWPACAPTVDGFGSNGLMCAAARYYMTGFIRLRWRAL
jgi:hypothetical protein